jgi:hypothetical protein
MRLYRITIHDPDWGLVFEWHRNKADAQRRMKELNGERAEHMPECDLEAMTVPTDKDGLVAFLNVHAGAGNG